MCFPPFSFRQDAEHPDNNSQSVWASVSDQGNKVGTLQSKEKLLGQQIPSLRGIHASRRIDIKLLRCSRDTTAVEIQR